MSRSEFEKHFPLRKPPVWGGAGSVERSISMGDVEAVREAIAEAIDVNERDEYQQTLLMIAAAAMSPQITALLLAAGANPNLLSDDQSGPLTSAVLDAGQERLFGRRRVNREVVTMLLQAGADPDQCDIYGRTPAERVSKSHGLRALFKRHGYRGDFSK